MQAEPARPSVLFVEPDHDRLLEGARALRARGARVSLASSAAMACERARTGEFVALVVTADALAPDADGMGLTDHLSIVLAEVPPLLVLADLGDRAIESVSRQIGELGHGSGPAPSLAPMEIDLAVVPLAELLSTLSAEERSATVRVVSRVGRGEVRMLAGSVHAAVFSGLGAEKSMHRLLALHEGTARVDRRAVEVVRVLDEPLAELLASARRERAQCDGLRAELESLVGAELVTVALGGGATDSHRGGLALRVVERLRGPCAVDSLLDELAEADSDVLAVLVDLARKGKLRRVDAAHPADVVATVFDIEAVRARAARASRPGFSDPPRVVIAAIPARIAVLEHTLTRLSDVQVPDGPAPSIPCPRPAARVRFGEGVELELAVLPLVPAYAPLWPLALSGAAAVVRLDEAAVSLLEEASAIARAPGYAVARLDPNFDEADPDRVAALIRAVLEAAPGE